MHIGFSLVSDSAIAVSLVCGMTGVVDEAAVRHTYCAAPHNTLDDARTARRVQYQSPPHCACRTTHDLTARRAVARCIEESARTGSAPCIDQLTIARLCSCLQRCWQEQRHTAGQHCVSTRQRLLGCVWAQTGRSESAGR